MARRIQKAEATTKVARVVGDRIQIEFVIDDLVKQLVRDRISPVANCNGCSHCSAALDIPDLEQRR